MSDLLSRAKLFTKKNASTILTCVGGVGVVATSVMAVKATPKVLTLLEKAKEEKGEELTKLETVRVAGPSYIPTVIVGTVTIACIFGANALNKRQQAALMSAYALLNESFTKYKNKMNELYGESSNIRIREEIAKDEYDESDIEIEDNKQLFFDNFSLRYFESTIEDVQRAEYRLNRTLVMRDYVYLNEFYEMLGIPPLESGYELGWSKGACLSHYWQEWLDFNHEKVVMDDGLECYIITMQEEPIPNFQDYC